VEQIYLTQDEGKGRPNSKGKIKSKVFPSHIVKAHAEWKCVSMLS